VGKAKDPLARKTRQAANAMFDCLADFIEVAGKEDKKFIVLLYNLSQYKAVSDLPEGIVDLDSLPEEIDKWLAYSPQAKPCTKGGNVYMAILTGLSMPFITFIKKLSLWCKEKKFRPLGGILASRKTGANWLATFLNKYNGPTSPQRTNYRVDPRHPNWSLLENDQHGNSRTTQRGRLSLCPPPLC